MTESFSWKGWQHSLKVWSCDNDSLGCHIFANPRVNTYNAQPYQMNPRHGLFLIAALLWGALNPVSAQVLPAQFDIGINAASPAFGMTDFTSIGAGLEAGAQFRVGQHWKTRFSAAYIHFLPDDSKHLARYSVSPIQMGFERTLGPNQYAPSLGLQAGLSIVAQKVLPTAEGAWGAAAGGRFTDVVSSLGLSIDQPLSSSFSLKIQCRFQERSRASQWGFGPIYGTMGIHWKINP